MVLAFIGGLFLGSGVADLLSDKHLFPRTIARVFVIIGIVIIMVGIASV